MHATENPGCERTFIGHIELKDTFTTSDFGVNQFFFMHQIMEDDFSLRLEWVAQVDVGCIVNPWGTQPLRSWACTLSDGDVCGTSGPMLAIAPFLA